MKKEKLPPKAREDKQRGYYQAPARDYWQRQDRRIKRNRKKVGL